MSRNTYEAIVASGLWVVCPGCGNDKRFKRIATERITDTIRKRYMVCRECSKRITVLEDKGAS